MTISTKNLQDGFWEKYQIQEKDIEYLFNHLIEVEEPQTPEELLRTLILAIIDQEKKRIEKQQQSTGAAYSPKNHYDIGQNIVFPLYKWETGKVTQVRPGFNPEIPSFEVIDVEFGNGETHKFAASLEDHMLNQAINVNLLDPALDSGKVSNQFGTQLIAKLNQALETNSDMVRIAGRWFPRTLLVDINIGYLNLAEAVLDMNNGGPLSTSVILEQIGLPTDVNLKLTEFSLNYALDQDERFDEIGPSGKVFWFLNKEEPEYVNNLPRYLRFSGDKYDSHEIVDMINQFDHHIIDELENGDLLKGNPSQEIPYCLIYPHWRSGTLPITGALTQIFPTAYESSKVLFKFNDLGTNQTFNGWVVLKQNYVLGLEEWYNINNLIPGNILFLSKSTQPGVVNIRIDKRKPGREWIRTAIVNPHGNISFSMMKQMVCASYDERMAIYISDAKEIDKFWENNGHKLSVEKAVLTSMLELSKLNPQGQVHAQELYAVTNIIKRCPPGLILNTLIQSQKASYLGDLYFRLIENVIGLN